LTKELMAVCSLECQPWANVDRQVARWKVKQLLNQYKPEGHPYVGLMPGQYRPNMTTYLEPTMARTDQTHISMNPCLKSYMKGIN